MSLRPSSSSLPASPGRRCVCLTCSSSLESLRAGLKNRNPQSLFGPLCQMKRCLNLGIVMQSICEPNFGRILQCCFHQHLSHVVHSIYPPSFYKPLSLIQQFHDYSANILIESLSNNRTPLALSFLLSLDVPPPSPSVPADRGAVQCRDPDLALPPHCPMRC